ncbi:MAG: hypothetical protein EOP04_17220 [Proteobacteria bacterium]|nr:MAG: hypothetical protein EOP04_17220 [Pseudomonadota bacterium]
MRNFIFLLAITLFLACQSNSSSNESSNTSDSTNIEMKGAYAMTKQIGNDGTKDTLLKKEQLKIYSDHYMMYASPRATDSFGEYVIATYSQNGGQVKEYIFYTSTAGEVKDTALLQISKLPSGYRQVIKYVDSSSTFILTEDYDKVGKEPTSKLDGAWRLTGDIFINGKGDTTTHRKKTQFKIYQSGYFIWANPNKDPASNNFYSAYGYGTFKMLNDTTTQETNINSTFYSQLVGKPVEIQLEFNGTDKYKQTISSGAEGRSVELYEKLK